MLKDYKKIVANKTSEKPERVINVSESPLPPPAPRVTVERNDGKKGAWGFSGFGKSKEKPKKPRKVPTVNGSTESQSSLIDKNFTAIDMRLFHLVSSYMEIVMNTAKDILPKMIVSMILDNTKRFIREDFYVRLNVQK